MINSSKATSHPTPPSASSASSAPFALHSSLLLTQPDVTPSDATLPAATNSASHRLPPAIQASASLPVLKAAPTASSLLRTCLQRNQAYDFSTNGEWLTARKNKTSGDDGGSLDQGPLSVSGSDDSVIILDDSVDEGPISDDVFVFKGTSGTPLKDEKSSPLEDSIIILDSPTKDTSSDLTEELPEADVDLDSSLCVTSHKVRKVCPITQQPFVYPKKNPLCQHVYEASAIMTMIRARWAKGKFVMRCPVGGCQQTVTYSSLVEEM